MLLWLDETYDTTAIIKPRSHYKMTSVSSNIDTCLVCSLTVPDVVSDNGDICIKVFSSEVSVVKWQSYKLNTVTTTNVVFFAQKTLSNSHISEFEKKRTCDWHSWNNDLFSCLKTPTCSWTETNQVWLKKSLSDESPWFVGTPTRHSSQSSP